LKAPVLEVESIGTTDTSPVEIDHFTECFVSQGREKAIGNNKYFKHSIPPIIVDDRLVTNNY